MSEEYPTREVKPISPQEISDNWSKQIPPEVIEAFNFLIEKNYNGSNRISRVDQNDVVEEILKRTNLTRHEIFSKRFLDIEDLYRKEGWVVSYNKPVYNEDYEVCFIFKSPPAIVVYIPIGLMYKESYKPI